MLRAPSGLLLSLALLAARPAVAEDATAVEARAHFDAGVKAFDTGDYDRAVTEFESAYQLKPHPDLLINLGTTYERMYRAAKARECYERFLAGAAPEHDLRSLAEKRLRVLRALPGTILVDAGIRGARVTLTGNGVALQGESPFNSAELPPGTYQVHVSAPGYVPIDQQVTLAPAQSHAITQQLQKETGNVTVFSVPEGAHVFLDDRDTSGVTPFSRSIEVGPHRLRLELPDRPPVTERFTLDPGKPIYRRQVIPPWPRSGRVEMLIGAMAIGGYTGAALPIAIGGAQVTAGTGLIAPILGAAAGVALGAVLSWTLTDDAMKVGHSSIIVGTSVWGALAGGSLALGLGLTGDAGRKDSQQNLMAMTVLGAGLGLGSGILTAWLADPTPGDAALVNSGAIWGTTSTVLLTEALSLRRSNHDPVLGWLSLGGNAAGLATGALLARSLDVSRRHVGIIDAAGLIGTIVGYVIGYSAGDDTPDAESGTVCPGPVNRCVSGARYAIGGMALGLLVAAILTRRFKLDLPRTDALLQHHDGRWGLGLPSVRLASVLTPQGLDQRAIVDLVHGEW